MENQEFTRTVRGQGSSLDGPTFQPGTKTGTEIENGPEINGDDVESSTEF